MRLVIDLQGAQGGSRLRGIGRLSRELALAMAKEAGHHEVLVALNGAFPDSIDDLTAAFAGILSRDAMRVWYPAGRTAAIEPDSDLRLRATEHIRARFLRSLVPDLVHVSSLFEGIDDDVVTSLPANVFALPGAATLYDLIPLIRRDQYLDGAWIGTPVRAWYLRMVEELRRMPGLLAISESSRNEAIDHLGISPGRVFNIRAGVSPSFHPVPPRGDARSAFLARYGLSEGYVLFLGGGDLRKNEAGLIAAFGLLPPDIRGTHKLAIVGKVEETALRAKATAAGIAATDLILIPFVDEADLAAIYSNCALFVFPSLHEGFGLPAAEAMACGAPVIGSNCTSLPEVIGRADALFDPYQPASIAQLMLRALTDGDFRHSLAEHGLKHARGFTWADSAKRAWRALEAIADQPDTGQIGAAAAIRVAQPRQRLTLAMTSPMPPQHSGIADYTYHLLPALAKYYDITVVTADPEITDPAVCAKFEVLTPAEFISRAATFDRILHQLGNSEFHRFQIDTLLPLVPGVLVLHDVFLSNVLHHIEHLDGAPERFLETLLMTHGIQGPRTVGKSGLAAAVQEFPCSLRQIQQSAGVILHSRHAQGLIERFYGSELAAATRIVPALRKLPAMPSRSEARARLNLTDSAVVVATFGGVADTKMPRDIIAGFAASNLVRRDEASLVFVGKADSELAEQLVCQARAANIGQSVIFTQRVTTEGYHDWLAAVDIAVQLRADSRGETSGAAADCLAAGLPAIVNAHGSLAELPAGAVIMLSDRFKKTDLAAAIDRLADSADLRRDLGEVGRVYAVEHLSTGKAARAYHDAIEAFYAAETPAMAARDVLCALEGIEISEQPGADTIKAIGHSLARSFPSRWPRRVMLDITAWSEPGDTARHQWFGIALALLSGTEARDRGELLDWRNGGPVHAWGEAARLLRIEAWADTPARPAMRGDLLLCPMRPGPVSDSSLALAAWARRGGAQIVGLAWSREDLIRAGTRPDIDVIVVLEETADLKTESDCAALVRALCMRVAAQDGLVPGNPLFTNT